MMRIDKLFTDKTKGGLIYILLAMGIILLVFGNSAVPESREEKTVQNLRTLEAEMILSEIKGAGRVSVMLSEEEKNKKTTFSSEDKEKKNEIGVLIVADGGNDSAVCEKLIRAAAVALGVSPHKIEVFERK